MAEAGLIFSPFQDLDPVQSERAKTHADALCFARKESLALEARLRDCRDIDAAIASLGDMCDARQAYPQHQALGIVLSAMLKRGATDAHLIKRPKGAAEWSLRIEGQEIPVDGESMPDSASFLREAADAFDIRTLDGSEINWEEWPMPGSGVADLGKHRLHSRFQSHPISPAGVFATLRATASPILTPEQLAAKENRQARLRVLLSMIPQRHEESRQLYVGEMLDRLGDRASEHKALFGAVEAGDAETLRRLLDEGADPKWRFWGTEGNGDIWFSMATPLILAASLGHEECVGILLPVSDVDAVDFGGRTALHAAASHSPPNLNCMRILIPASLVDAPNFDGNSALAEAAWLDNVEALRLLAPCSRINLGSGCLAPLGDMCEPEPHCTALWVAAQEGNVECCKILIEHGADPRIANPSGKTAITNDGCQDRGAMRALRAQAARLNERDALQASICKSKKRSAARRI